MPLKNNPFKTKLTLSPNVYHGEVISESMSGTLNFQAFIGNNERTHVFLHNTSTEELAARIVSEGFRFVNHLNYSCDQVSPGDLVQIRYFTILRRSYGPITLVICIGKDLIDGYSKRLQGTSYDFSEVLTVDPPTLNDDGEPVYTLPPHFVKGYFNQNTGQGVLNPGFDPFLPMTNFEENLKKMLQGKWLSDISQ